MGWCLAPSNLLLQYSMPSVNDLKSPSYLVHGRDPLEGQLSNLQNYCRYVGDKPGRLVFQKLWKMWKLHVKLLLENIQVEPTGKKKITKATNLKISQLVFTKYHRKGTLDPTYIYEHRVSEILNNSTVILVILTWQAKKMLHLSHQTSDTSWCFY